MENTEVKKSLPIEVVGRATYANNEPGNYLIVRFKNIYDEERKITIPAEEVEQLSRLKKRLINHSYNLSNLHSWSDVKNILSDPPRTIERMDLVRTTGFHNGVFLLSDNQIIGKVPENKNRPFMDPDLLKGYLIDSPKGKLQDWKEHIASSGKYSSRIMLALSATFSAPLLHLTNIESGGFHFYGTSSTGKTTCQKIASSIQGSADNVESWSTTETGAEETAAKFNGSMLAYDELGSTSNRKLSALNQAISGLPM
jgi:putative DNA primase/helicase